MDSATENSLISKLQTSDLKTIHKLFSDHLQPFTDLTAPKPKKTKKPSKTAAEEDHRSTVRSLAKKFLPFLNQALSIIPKRLSETPKMDQQLGLELFETYRLCLNCLDCVSSQLSCKPYSFHIQRVRLIHCLEGWGRYKDAEVEGLSVLESLMGIEIGVTGSRKAKSKGKFLPCCEGDSVDSEFATLVVEIVVTFVKCASMNQTKDEVDYKRLLSLVDEVTPWFRVLDANTYEKLHRMLVTYISRCTLFLVGELTGIDGDLVHKFSLATFAEYGRSSMKDQMHKFARRMCSSLFSQEGNQSSSVTCILISVLNSMASECKVEMENTIIDFFELVFYCANKCRSASTNLCTAIATHLNTIAGDYFQGLLPFDLILGLYATGLLIGDGNGQSSGCDFASSGTVNTNSLVGFMLADEDRLQHLSAALRLLKHHFCISDKENRQKSGRPYFLLYYNALKFLCQPLAEIVNSGRKEIVADIELMPFTIKLCDIQDALNQFCVVVLLCHSVFERERDAFDDNDKTSFSVAVAAFTLSFRTKLKFKESASFIKHIISSDWIQAYGLKFLFASLHNIAVILYRNKQVNEASKALKLCCRASWTCVLRLCKTFIDKSNMSHGDVSEDAIVDFIAEASAKSVFLLDVLYQCGSHKLNKIIGDSLESWSVAKNLFDRLPIPVVLVKHWVKLECKLCRDVERGAITLYSLLSSSEKVSKRTLGILLEQELLAYTEMNALHPRVCQKMRMDVMTILLEEVYDTKESSSHKSRILISKARELRAHGVEGLSGSIHCLSEAIVTMNKMCGEAFNVNCPVRHQLAVAHFLRALCTHEAEPNSKLSLQDIRAALNTWLSLELCHVDDQCDAVSENILIMLYHIMDLLSMKGCTEFHPDIYEVIIRLFNLKNIPLRKCLVVLWEYRRLGHALCASPVNDAFITTLSKHSGELSESIEFWISCLNGLSPLDVGFQQNFFFMNTILSRGSCQHKSSFRPDITIDEVKQAAFGLISSVPISSGSAFLAAYLYYDLGERLISNGRLIEALSYAKEAHRLRSKLLQEKFTYTIEEQNEICDENGNTIQKRCYNLSTFQVYGSVATEVWSCENTSCDLEGCILTPWNVLQGYLESTLQVGIINEMIGNGYEAETLLLWGKNISCFQGLPHFIVAFSSVLGRLCRKQQLWDIAEKELQSARKILADSCTDISCLKCRLVLEVTIDQQLADLYRSHFDSDTGNPSVNKLSDAELLYESALDKLNLSEWKYSISNSKKTSTECTIVRDSVVKEGGHTASNSFAHCATNQSDAGVFPLRVGGPEPKVEVKKSRRAKKTSRPLQLDHCTLGEQNSRMTRSKYRSSQENSEIIPREVQIGVTKHSNGEHSFACADTLRQRGPPSESECCIPDLGYELKCSKVKCWYCLPIEAIESGSLNNFIALKWEMVRTQLSLRLLTSIGKCLGIRDKIHEAHDVCMKSISMLVNRSSFCPSYSSVPLACMLDLIEKEIPGDALAVERAAVLYNIGWFTLKSYPCRNTRIRCCDLSDIQMPRVMTWLKFAFVLSREVPILFRKVSRLLAALYILSASNVFFSPFPSPSPSPCNALSESHWASYFHQASLGTHLNHQLLSTIIGKQKANNPLDVEGSCLAGSTSVGSEALNFLRLAPESLQHLEGFVLRFFEGLPCSTVICISLLGGAYTSLLRELLLYPTCVHAWILISRMNSSSQPIVILLPVDSIIQASDDDNDEPTSGSANLFEGSNSVKRWHCPWGSTVVDIVAPIFRLILEENYLSSSIYPIEDTKQNRSLWWMQRKRLDQRLGKFLSDLEDSWLGPWKYLLLGEWSDCKHLDSVQKKLVHDLKYKCKLEVPENLLKLILGGAKYACEREECVLQLILNRGCCNGGVGYSDQERWKKLSSVHDDIEISQLLFKLVVEACHEVQEEAFLVRGPIILVLDFDVQMLPWENLPILRNQEVYRMPSVGSISATLDQFRHHQEHLGRNTLFPSIDPLDAFYLLNPSGDLSSTQVEFENWFRDQNLEGTAGTTPTIEELTVALKSHDLFIYFGHGSGAQYIPGHEIQKLENCAATLLMGCSSGSLSLNGCYTPRGAPLYYLLAGSPVIVANLWEVTDKDIDRFGKAMLDSWLRERSSVTTSCAQCSLVSNVSRELESMTIGGTQRNGRKKISRKKLPESSDTSTCNDCCNHRPKIGSFMGQAREACTLSFLIGASPVCYGVPTGIWRKKDL